MFGELISLRSPPPPPTPAVEPGPKFPSYLLPSPSFFKLSSFRRQRSQPSPDTPPSSSPESPSRFFFYSSSSSSSSSSSPLSSPGGFTGPRLSQTAPSTISCITCRSDLAFHSQIVSKGFHGRHGKAVLVSPPSHHQPTATPVAAAVGSQTYRNNNNHNNNKQELLNTRLGRAESRHLATGAHVVADLFCSTCDTKLGWKYVDATAESQKYKIGKFILENARVVVEHSWEDVHFVAVHDSSAVATSGTTTPPLSPPGHKGKGRQNDDDDDDDDEEEEQEVGIHTGNQLDDETAVKRKHTHGDKESQHHHYHDENDNNGDGVIEFDSDDEDECEDIFAGVWDPEVTAKRREKKAHNRKKGWA